MRQGTHGFAGSRLRQARRARGLSGVDLADMVGVKSQTISAHELDKSTPSPQLVEQLATVLNVPVNFFVLPTPKSAQNTIFWRANSTATRIAQERAEVRLEWFQEIVEYFRTYFDFPHANLPQLAFGSDFKSIKAAQIECAAKECRDHWGLGTKPIFNIVADLEENGVLVTTMTLEADKLDAFSQMSEFDSTPYVVLGEDKASGPRRNFDAAHELGHLILHSKVDKKHINIAADLKIIEAQAHHFARAFLMPADAFEADLWAPSLDAFVSLKTKWNASAQSMIFRCADLEIIDVEQQQSLWINANRRGWKKKEPLDDTIQMSQPGLMTKSVEMLVDEKVRRPDQIVSDLGLPAKEIEDLTRMPRGYFSGKDAAVVPLARFRTDAQGSRQTSMFEGENVVPISSFKRR